LNLVSATTAANAARARLDEVSDPATRPDISGMPMHDARDALRDWEQGVLDARMDLLRANAALLDARIEHA
jgi:hypothetical protein